MSSQVEFWSLFSDSITERIFDFIAKRRRAPYKDIIESLQIGKEAASLRLHQLRQANLIDAVNAPLEDFTMYYLTEEGLSAERTLRKG